MANWHGIEPGQFFSRRWDLWLRLCREWPVSGVNPLRAERRPKTAGARSELRCRSLPHRDRIIGAMRAAISATEAGVRIDVCLGLSRAPQALDRIEPADRLATAAAAAARFIHDSRAFSLVHGPHVEQQRS